jgi:isocitrate dehydrogenase
MRHAAKAEDQAQAIERAISAAITAGCRTVDIAEPNQAPLSCSGMANEIAARI